MIKKFKQWLLNRVVTRDEKLYQAGYNYAAGLLLELGEPAVAVLRQQANALDRNNFDVGINCAVNVFERQIKINQL